VTCLYINPVFESPSNHRYDTSDYHSVDPILGDEKALSELCCKAFEFGIKVMLDGVFSHTGADSVYFDLYGRYPEPGAAMSPDSKYREWYDFKNWPEEYRCWWGFKTLPEVNELTPSYIRFIEGVLEHWAAAGVTNWRLDVADELPDDFMRALYRKLKSLDPEGVLLGEVWEDASNKFSMGHRRPYTDGGVLDSVMNYPFRTAVMGFLTGRTDAFVLKDELLTQREAMPKPFYEALLNLLGSHDTERALSVLCGFTGENLSREQQACFDPPEQSVIIGKKRMKLAALIQFSVPGVPCIYYTDEAGTQGLSDPFNRGTYPWGREDEDLLGFYRLISKKRGESPALSRGLCAFAALSRDVFLTVREYGRESVISAVNRGETEALVSVSRDDFSEGEDGGKLTVSGSYTDLFSGARFDSSGGRLDIVLGPLTGILLCRC
jgi:4-alpha-glucanotransferase